MKKTLGGDRLHAGKKMEVDIKEYGYSNHNLSRTVRTTSSAGTLIPIAKWLGLPGDTFRFDNINLSVLTHPTLGPLFGSMDATIDIFEAPWRLYLPKLHNNTSDIGTDMDVVKLPQVKLMPMNAENIDWNDEGAMEENMQRLQTSPSSLLRYMGITSVGYWDYAVHNERPEREFLGIDIFAYWDIVKNYYSNKQEKILAFIDGTVLEDSQNVEDIYIGTESVPSSNKFGIYPDQDAQNVTTATWLWLKLTDDQQPQIESLYINVEPVPGFYPLITGIQENTASIVEYPISSGEYWYKVKSKYNGTTSMWAWASQIHPDNGVPAIQTFPLENIDKMRDYLLSQVLSTNPVYVNDLDYSPFRELVYQTDRFSNYQQTQSGIALKTYKSDIFNNWLNTTDINNVLTRASVTTAGGSFNMDSLILANKIYEMLNTLIVSGNTYEDFLETMYGQRSLDKCTFPLYHGSIKRELIFQEVVQSASTSTDASPLGTLAGRGRLMDGKDSGMTIRLSEYATIMAIFSLTPRIDYSQGNDFTTMLRTVGDLHVPQLDAIGFQDAITEKAVAIDTYWNGTSWVQKSYGKQPAWLDYMTDYNRVYGNFASEEESFMVLDRRYSMVPTGLTPQIKDMTSYIDPTRFNFIFAQAELDAQNYWVQAHFDLEVRRKMSNKIMPSL